MRPGRGLPRISSIEVSACFRFSSVSIFVDRAIHTEKGYFLCFSFEILRPFYLIVLPLTEEKTVLSQ